MAFSFADKKSVEAQYKSLFLEKISSSEGIIECIQSRYPDVDKNVIDVGLLFSYPKKLLQDMGKSDEEKRLTHVLGTVFEPDDRDKLLSLSDRIILDAVEFHVVQTLMHKLIEEALFTSEIDEIAKEWADQIVKYKGNLIEKEKYREQDLPPIQVILPIVFQSYYFDLFKKLEVEEDKLPSVYLQDNTIRLNPNFFVPWTPVKLNLDGVDWKKVITDAESGAGIYSRIFDNAKIEDPDWDKYFLVKFDQIRQSFSNQNRNIIAEDPRLMSSESFSLINDLLDTMNAKSRATLFNFDGSLKEDLLAQEFVAEFKQKFATSVEQTRVLNNSLVGSMFMNIADKCTTDPEALDIFKIISRVQNSRIANKPFLLQPSNHSTEEAYEKKSKFNILYFFATTGIGAFALGGIGAGLVTAAIFAGYGGLLGALGGPIGIAVGAAVGFVVGAVVAAVGFGIAHFVRSRKEQVSVVVAAEPVAPQVTKRLEKGSASQLAGLGGPSSLREETHPAPVSSAAEVVSPSSQDPDETDSNEHKPR